MKSANNKEKKQREYAIQVPAATVRKIQKAALGYGNRQKLATASGVNTTTINHVITYGRATQTNIEKLLAGIKLMKTETAA